VVADGAGLNDKAVSFQHGAKFSVAHALLGIEPGDQHTGWRQKMNELHRHICNESYERPIMRQPRLTITHALDSRQVLFRFLFRLLLLIAFATFATRGFGTTFSALLAMSAIFCAVAGAMRREQMLGPVLTHWDEAAAYAVLGHVAAVLA